MMDETPGGCGDELAESAANTKASFCRWCARVLLTVRGHPVAIETVLGGGHFASPLVSILPGREALARVENAEGGKFRNRFSRNIHLPYDSPYTASSESQTQGQADWGDLWGPRQLQIAIGGSISMLLLLYSPHPLCCLSRPHLLTGTLVCLVN